MGAVAVAGACLAACSAAPAPRSGPVQGPGTSTTASHSGGRAPTSSTSTSAATGTGREGIPAFSHLFVVVMENEERQGALATPQVATLARRYASAGDWYAVAHPSLPNYLALFSGSTHGIRDDGRYDLSGPNLASSLISAGLTFAGYSEDLPALGFRGDSHRGYVRKHAPWASFTNVPDTVNRPLADFPAGDFTALPTVSFVIPTLSDDMHDGSVAQGDQWLRTHVEAYARWAVSHNSLLIVTFDEGPVFPAPADTRIATIMVGAHVRTGTSDQRITHYSILRTLEDFYGLPPIGEDQSASTITGIWN